MADLATLVIAVDSTDVPKAQKAMDGLGNAAEALEGIIGKVAAAWASWKVVQYAKEAALLSARYETLAVVMGVVGNNAGYTSREMDGFAASLQKTGISMVESRNSLAIMAQAHIDLSKATQLGRLAQDAAVIGNLNSSEAFQRMIYGIQSGQTEILRTIGLNVNFENSYKKLAGQLKKNVADLTEYEKVTARTNAVMEKGPDIAGAYSASMETAGKQLLSAKRYAEDLQVAFGAVFGGVTGVAVQAINQAFIDMKKWLDENAVAVQTISGLLEDAAGNAAGLVKDMVRITVESGKISEEFSLGEIAAASLASAVAIIRDAVMAVYGGIQLVAGGILTMVSGAMLAIAKLFEMVSGFKPPKWVQDFYDRSLATGQAGINNMQGNSITRLMNGGSDFSAEILREQAKADKAAEAERKRIEDGKAARKKQEEESKLKAAKDAAKKRADVMRESQAAAEAIVLQQQIDGIWAEELQKRGIAASDAAVRAAQATAAWELATADYVAREQEKQRLFEDGVRMSQQYLSQEERRAQEVERTNALYKAGGLSLEAYQRRLMDLDPMIGPAITAMEQFGDTAADAFARWVTGMDTASIHWSNMVRSMMADWTRMMAQQGMNSLFNYIVGSVGNWAFGGGTPITTSLDSSLTQPLPSQGSMPTYTAPQGAPSVSVVVNNAAGPGSGITTQASGGALGNMLGAAVQQVLAKEMRPGGMLNPVGGRA